MKRSGGKSGRPLAHLSIERLEAHAHDNKGGFEELLILKNELGFRRSKRACELRDLVSRLIRNSEL